MAATAGWRRRGTAAESWGSSARPAGGAGQWHRSAHPRPSSNNRQHWDFVLVTDRDQLTRLSTVWQGAGHIAGAAAAVALVLPEGDDERGHLTDRFDLGQATFAMMLAAADLGIGSGHSGVGDQESARAILGVPDDHRVAYLLGIGYPAGRALRPIARPDRRPFDEVVHRGHW